MHLKIQNTLSVKLFQLLQSLNIVSFSIPLFEPEAYHTENYKLSPNNVGVSFIKNPSYWAAIIVYHRISTYTAKSA